MDESYNLDIIKKYSNLWILQLKVDVAKDFLALFYNKPLSVHIIQPLFILNPLTSALENYLSTPK